MEAHYLPPPTPTPTPFLPAGGCDVLGGDLADLLGQAVDLCDLGVMLNLASASVSPFLKQGAIPESLHPEEELPLQ